MYPKWSILGPFYLSSAICGHYTHLCMINLSNESLFFYHILSFSPFPLPSSQLSVDWLPISGISALTDIIKCQVQRPIDQKKKETKNSERSQVWAFATQRLHVQTLKYFRLWYKHLQHRSTAKLDILTIHSFFSRSWSKLLHLTHDWWKLYLT